MSRNGHAKDHKRNTEKYLNDTKRGYTVNLQSGLYEPSSPNTKQERDAATIQEIQHPRPKSSWADWSNVGVGVVGNAISVLTLLGLLVTAWFSIKQWRAAHITANASIISAEAAQESAKAARDSVKQAAAATKLEERPWISLQGVSCVGCSRILSPARMALPPTQSDSLTIQQVTSPLVNSGKTPALHMQIEFFSFVRETDLANPIVPTWDSVVRGFDALSKTSMQGLSRQDVERQRHLFVPTRLGPYTKILIAPMSLAPQAPFGLILMHEGKLEREYITRNKKVIYILGKITYYDSTTSQKYPPPYVTTLCIENTSWTPDGFTQCPSGNDMK
jgi:hypothetical protein